MCDCRSHNGFLTAKGLEETDQRRLSLSADLAGGESLFYLDKVGSVSALVDGRRRHIWPLDKYLDEQYRRFLDDVKEG